MAPSGETNPSVTRKLELFLDRLGERSEQSDTTLLAIGALRSSPLVIFAR